MPQIHRVALIALVALVCLVLSPRALRAAAAAADVPEPEAVPAAPPAPSEPLGEPVSDTGEPAPPSQLLGGRPVAPEAARLTELGLQLMRQRHFAEAIDTFKSAASADSKHPVLWNNLGSAYLTLGKPIKAQGAFSRAISLDPNYAMAHYNLGAVLDEGLDYDGAVASYARALELDPALGRPEKNPSVVNNTHLAAVHLVLYKRQVGALGTGITPVTGPDEGSP